MLLLQTLRHYLVLEFFFNFKLNIYPNAHNTIVKNLGISFIALLFIVILQ